MCLLIDAANLKSVVRTARMHKSADFLSDVLIRGATDIDRLVGADADALAAVFAHTPLEKAAAAGGEAMSGGSMTVFERACDNAVNDFAIIVFRRPIVAHFQIFQCSLLDETSFG